MSQFHYSNVEVTASQKMVVSGAHLQNG